MRIENAEWRIKGTCGRHLNVASYTTVGSGLDLTAGCCSRWVNLTNESRYGEECVPYNGLLSSVGKLRKQTARQECVPYNGFVVLNR